MTRVSRPLGSSRVARAALVLSTAASVSAASPARAADPRTEAAASGAIHKASEAYLATDYARAVAVLRKALRACGASRCGAPTRAAVLRDLAVMQFRTGDASGAAQSFAAAQTLQVGIALNPDYDAPDVRAALGVATPPEASPPAEPPVGDFTHTPVSEQKANTPLPVYVEIDGIAVSRVIVRYRGVGMIEPAQVEMRHMNAGWGALVPCGAVKSGDLRYWIVGFDASGEPTASSGNPNHPFHVHIREKNRVRGAAPSGPRSPGDVQRRCYGVRGCRRCILGRGGTWEARRRRQGRPLPPLAASCRAGIRAVVGRVRRRYRLRVAPRWPGRLRTERFAKTQ